MSDEVQVLQLFDNLLHTPLLAEDSGSSNIWRNIDHFRYVTNQDEHVLFYAVSQDFYDVDYDVYSAVEQSYHARFEQIVTILTRAWGEPQVIPYDTLMKASDKAPYLEHDIYWRGGLALAYWCRGDRVAYIEVEHQDKELPIFLLLCTRRMNINKSSCNEGRSMS